MPFAPSQASRLLISCCSAETSSGVVISRLNPKGQAYQKGLRPGDIIIKVQASPIQNHNEFKKQIVKNIHRESVVFLVQRGQYGYYVNFEL